ncbi:MAG: hypothetical protein WAK63_15175 [Xanthobacteraceae bacterium]
MAKLIDAQSSAHRLSAARLFDEQCIAVGRLPRPGGEDAQSLEIAP